MSEHRRRILIVDDDRDFAESTAAYLRAHGLEVVQAHSGEEGLKAARLEAPDLILMDIMMEERTEGFFTVQQLRRDRSLKEVPIFVVSSLYSDVPDFRIEPDPAWAAYDEFLPKPVDLDRLMERIEARIGDRAAAPAREAP
jgi:DNA-binding response OmpR family regulator